MQREEEAALGLTLDQCESVRGEQLVRLLEIELVEVILQEGEGPELERSVQITCEQERILITLRRGEHEIFTREIAREQGASASVEERLVSIAILALPLDAPIPKPERPEEQPASPHEQEGAKAPPPPPWRAGIQLEGMMTLRRSGLAIPGVGAWLRSPGRVALEGEVALQRTTRETPAGEVELLAPGARLQGVWRLFDGQLWLDLGAGAQLSAVRMRGVDPAPGFASRSVWGQWVGAFASARLGLDLSPRSGVSIRAQLGQSIVGVEALAPAPALRWHGVYAQLALGATLRF